MLLVFNHFNILQSFIEEQFTPLTETHTTVHIAGEQFIGVYWRLRLVRSHYFLRAWLVVFNREPNAPHHVLLQLVPSCKFINVYCRKRLVARGIIARDNFAIVTVERGILPSDHQDLTAILSSCCSTSSVAPINSEHTQQKRIYGRSCSRRRTTAERIYSRSCSRQRTTAGRRRRRVFQEVSQLVSLSNGGRGSGLNGAKRV